MKDRFEILLVVIAFAIILFALFLALVYLGYFGG